MFLFTKDTSPEMIALAVVACDVAAYQLFYYVAKFGNQVRVEGLVAPRVLGCIGIVFSTILLTIYAKTALVDAQVYATLSSYEQGQYMGRIMRAMIFPGLIGIGIIAARGWRDAQQRKYEAKKKIT